MSKTPKPPAETSEAGPGDERSLTGGAALLANWNTSLADFYVRRLQKYWQYPLDLADMRSLEEVAQSLIEFERELLADYADQADELQRIVGGERKAHAAPSQPYEARILKAQKDAALIIDQAKAQAERILASARSQAAEAKPGGGEEVAEAARKSAHG
jgi:hypothetical protein